MSSKRPLLVRCLQLWDRQEAVWRLFSTFCQPEVRKTSQHQSRSCAIHGQIVAQWLQRNSNRSASFCKRTSRVKRKCLSVENELLGNPCLMLVDERTSGRDRRDRCGWSACRLRIPTRRNVGWCKALVLDGQDTNGSRARSREELTGAVHVVVEVEACVVHAAVMDGSGLVR